MDFVEYLPCPKYFVDSISNFYNFSAKVYFACDETQVSRSCYLKDHTASK